MKQSQKFALSLKELHKEYGEHLTYSSVIKTEDKDKNGEDIQFYDLMNDKGEFVCMDGEICENISKGKDYILLVSEEDNKGFKLTKKEYGIATFGWNN